MDKYIEAARYYVDKHIQRYPSSLEEGLCQVASVDIHGNYTGELIISCGVPEHIDETPTYIETIDNPNSSYKLKYHHGKIHSLSASDSFYCDTTAKHELINELETRYPWIGISIVGAKPSKHYLNLYKHILTSAYVNDIDFSGRSSVYYSFLDLNI
jgi:hypothetical protein